MCVCVVHSVLIPPARYTLIHSQSARLSCTCASSPLSPSLTHTLRRARTLPSWFRRSKSVTHWICFTPACCGLFGSTHERRHGGWSNRPGKLWSAGQPQVLIINSVYGSMLSSVCVLCGCHVINRTDSELFSVLKQVQCTTFNGLDASFKHRSHSKDP